MYKTNVVAKYKQEYRKAEKEFRAMFKSFAIKYTRATEINK